MARAKKEPAAHDLQPSVKRRKLQKHIGGYFDSDMLERIALLRARLDMDNSQSMSFIPKRGPKKHSASDCTCALLQLCTILVSHSARYLENGTRSQLGQRVRILKPFFHQLFDSSREGENIITFRSG